MKAGKTSIAALTLFTAGTLAAQTAAAPGKNLSADGKLHQPAESGEIRLECCRPSHLYRTGETVTFSITGPDSKKLTVELSSDGEAILDRREIVVPAKVSFLLSRPGFLRCTVRSKGRKPVMAAVACDPEQVRPVLPEPEDFDEFWKKEFDKLAKTPERFKMNAYGKLPGATLYELECGNSDGSTVYGFLRMPDAAGKVPLLVYFEGAGCGQNQESFRLHCATADRFLKGPLALLTICTHPFRPGKTTEEHQKRYNAYLKKLGVKSYWLEGLGSKSGNTFFQRMIPGSVRMCNLVSALPEIDPSRIAYLGASQGGQFGLYLTALCPQIRAAFCGVPAFGDCGGFLAGAHTVQSNLPEFKKHVQLLRYFDTVNFARRIKVPVFISAGYIDGTCTPTSVFAIANELGGPKLVFHKIHHGHGDAPPEYEALTWFWIGRHLGLEM